MRIGKKGFSSFEKVWNLLLALALLAFGVFAVIMPAIGEYYVMTDFSVNQLQNDILTSRFMTSPDCLAFEDAPGVTHAGVIDLDEISNANNCLDDEPFILKLYNYDDYDGGTPIETEENLPNNIKEPQTYTFLVNYVEEGCYSNCELNLAVLEVTTR